MERTTSACYDQRESQWEKIGALIEGDGAEQDYIMPLPGMPDPTDFKARAYYMNATARTVEAFSGLPMSKSLSVEGIEGFEHLRENTTRDGLSLEGLARRSVEAVLAKGRCGVLVDYPQTSDVMTVAEAEANHIHSFARFYDTKAILDFDLTTVGARQFLSWLLLEEEVTQDGERVKQLRELEIVDGAAQLVLYREDGDQWVQYGDTVTLTRNGAPLDFIPFRFINPTDGRPGCVKPPMLDIANVSVSHLNNSASLEWGLMWTGAPTPCFVNLVADDGDVVGLGSSEGIQLGEGGNAFFLEFSGQGLGAIRQRMEDKQRDMAILGARLFADDKKGVEAAETTRMRRTGEQASLASITDSVSEAMTDVMRWMVEWDGGDADGVSVRLSKAFLKTPISFDELESGLLLLQSGEITQRTFFSMLQEAELVAPEVSAEDYREELEDEAPVLPGLDAA